jgi:hypothetical protein
VSWYLPDLAAAERLLDALTGLPDPSPDLAAATASLAATISRRRNRDSRSRTRARDGLPETAV